jgi:hypothetical protein
MPMPGAMMMRRGRSYSHSMVGDDALIQVRAGVGDGWVFFRVEVKLVGEDAVRDCRSRQIIQPGLKRCGARPRRRSSDWGKPRSGAENIMAFKFVAVSHRGYTWRRGGCRTCCLSWRPSGKTAGSTIRRAGAGSALSYQKEPKGITRAARWSRTKVPWGKCADSFARIQAHISRNMDYGPQRIRGHYSDDAARLG